MSVFDATEIPAVDNDLQSYVGVRRFEPAEYSATVKAIADEPARVVYCLLA